tara:strand:+ start:1950 stop:2558 length:609 start_codon:yes stop_codon:yes gene_type:complete
MDNGVKIGILGGTFDPIHLGHLHLANQAKIKLGLQKVLFVPAGDPWMKKNKYVTCSTHRLNMTYLALEKNNDFLVDDLEIKRQGKSYTIDTITELKNKFGVGSVFYLIVGEDVVPQIPLWKDPSKIMRMVNWAIVRRGSLRLPDASIGPEVKYKWIENSEEFLAISSSKIRKNVKEGLSIKKLVHTNVEKYICENRLYKDLD